MPEGNGTAAQRLAQWLRGLENFDLPDWDDLPQLDLYMDQVILLLTRYLAPLERGGDEKTITASIINNYVRMKVMPPPVKKRYSRVHLAYLVMICTLKQSLSISCIQRLLPEVPVRSPAGGYPDGTAGHPLGDAGLVRKDQGRAV